MSTEFEVSFSQYFENWHSKLVQILNEFHGIKHRSELLVNDQELRALVCKAQNHLREFYVTKWMAFQENILHFFSPVWLTPLETSSLWITGPRPSTPFYVVDSLKLMRTVAVGPNLIAFELTAEQDRRIQELRMRCKAEVESVEKGLKMLQVSVKTQKMVLGDAMADKVELVDGYVAWCRKIAKCADCVRLKTLKEVLLILMPLQRVLFYISYFGMQVRLRTRGKRLLRQESVVWLSETRYQLQLVEEE